MFHVGEKNIPENSHKVDVQHPESSRDKKEVDCLTWRPDNPVKKVDGGKFVNKLPPGLRGEWMC